MKKILLLSILILFISLSTYSQCDVRNIAVQLKQITNTGGQCEVLFDLSYEQHVNPGNKYAFIHLWRSDLYPDLLKNGLAYIPTSNHPDTNDLQNTLANMIITNNHDVTLAALGNSWPAEPTVPIMLTSQMSLSKEIVDADWHRTTIKNIFLTIPNCNGVSISGDIWGSQAAVGQNVHCYSTGFQFIVGNPRVGGLLKCTVPRTYNMSVQNVGAADIVITYKIYVDEGDMNYEPTTHDQLAATYSDPITITPGNSYAVTDQTYPPYNNLKPYSDHGIWIEVSVAGFPNKAIYFLNNLCAPLPVTFSSFTATRDKDRVNLRWITETELNNAGFEIQRMLGSDEYRFVTLVPSRAADGNSAVAISYTYSDVNPSSGVTMYRIRQVDIDGRFAYSPERMVAGNGKELHVYPNPVHGGSFNVVLEDYIEGYDVTLFDNYGRMVNQWFNVRQPELMINRPNSGLYTIRAMNRTTRIMKSAQILVLQ